MEKYLQYIYIFLIICSTLTVLLITLTFVKRCLPLKVQSSLKKYEYDNVINLFGLLLNILTVILALYAIEQVIKAEVSQNKKDTEQQERDTKQLRLDSLQTNYMERSRDLLDSIGNSSQQIVTNLQGVSMFTQNIPNQISDINNNLKSLNDLTLQHKNIIEEQNKQRARLQITNKNSLNGFSELRIENDGSKIATVSKVYIKIVNTGRVNIGIDFGNGRRDVNHCESQDTTTYCEDVEYEIGVKDEMYLYFYLNRFDSSTGNDIPLSVYNIEVRIHYYWDTNKSGDYITENLIYYGY